MMTSGLVAEVQKLKDMGYHRGMVSMQGLGYKEIMAYLEGEMPSVCHERGITGE